MRNHPVCEECRWYTKFNCTHETSKFTGLKYPKFITDKLITNAPLETMVYFTPPFIMRKLFGTCGIFAKHFEPMEEKT